jgi:dsRNA-specific ribonuclease
MPTYRIGPVKLRAGALSASRRPLICERCLAEVAEVWSVAEYSGLAAGVLAEKWPDVEKQVERHEAECRIAN